MRLTAWVLLLSIWASTVSAQTSALSSLRTRQVLQTVQEITNDPSKVTAASGQLYPSTSGFVRFVTPWGNLKSSVRDKEALGLSDTDAVEIRIELEKPAQYRIVRAQPTEAVRNSASPLPPTLRWQAHKAQIIFVSLVAGGDALLTAAKDGSVRLWSASDARPLDGPIGLRPAREPTGSAALSPDGKALALALADFTIEIWSLGDAKLRMKLHGHEQFVRAMAFSPDGRLLASGSQDSTLRIWSMSDGSLVSTSRAHDGQYVTAVAFSDDGSTLASGGYDRAVVLWSASGHPKSRFAVHEKVHALAFFPGGAVLAVGGLAQTISLWRDGRPEKDLSGHKDWVDVLAVAADGKRLVSAGEEVRVWSVEDGRTIARLRSGETKRVAASADARVIAAASSGTMMLWRLRE